MVNRNLWAVLGAVVLAACATAKPPSPWLKADEFMRQVQWERYKAAEAFIPAKEQKKFRDWTKGKEEGKLKITSYEPQKVDWESDTTAVTLYDVKYFIAPEYLEKTTEVEISWRLDKDHWLMNGFPKLKF